MTTSSPITLPDDDARYRAAVGVGFVLLVAYLFGTLWALEHTTYDIWGGILIAPVLGLVTYQWAKRSAMRIGDPIISRFIAAALLCKLGGTILRYVVIEEVYAGSADASVYHRLGSEIAASFRAGDFDVEVGKVVGTGFLELLTGFVYTVTGPTRFGGFVVFSWFGFIGLYLLYRAFHLAVPNGNHRRYAFLVLFMPSLLFWPSSIGKESWMLLTIGIATYGAALLLSHRRGGLIVFVVGLAGTTMVRPHVTLALFLGTALAYLLRRSPHRNESTRPLVLFLGVVALLVVGSVVVARVETFFKVDALDVSSVDQVLDRTSDRSTKSGSQFAPVTPHSPAEFPLAFVTVLFRPFPYEARNPQAMVTAAEGMFLLYLMLRSLRKIKGLGGHVRRAPFLALAVVYSLLFIYAFSSFGNFGLLARQRVQLTPFVFAIVCLGTIDDGRRRSQTRTERALATRDDPVLPVAPVELGVIAAHGRP